MVSRELKLAEKQALAMSGNHPSLEKYCTPDREYIARKFPELIQRPMPSIDQIVSLFLKQHDVDIQPPAGTGVLDGAIAGAITGYYGVEAGATVQVASNQTKIAAKQEWTSWKQWALSHAEWKQFKENTLKAFEEANAKTNALWLDPKTRKDVADAIEARNKLISKSNKQVLIIGCILAGVVVIGAVIDGIEKNKETPPTETRSRNYQ